MRTRFHGRRAAAATLAALLLGAVAVAPAAAITRGGTLDGDDHPMVGLLTVHAEGHEYLWRCSGTLISPTVFITAGHCTEPDDSQGFGLPAYGLIYFTSELIEPDPEFDIATRSCDGIEGYPCGDQGGELITRTGELFLHPEYDPNAFYTHDLGIVVLDEPLELDAYGVCCPSSTSSTSSSLVSRRASTPSVSGCSERTGLVLRGATSPTAFGWSPIRT